MLDFCQNSEPQVTAVKRSIGRAVRPEPKARRQVELGSAVLKKSGGSLVMTVPASVRDALHLTEGTRMSISLSGEQLVLEAVKTAKPKYTLEELLARCDLEAPRSDEERAWLEAPRAGRELL